MKQRCRQNYPADSCRDSDGFSPDDICKLIPLSRQAVERLEIFAATLDTWRLTTNLIGPEERSLLWRRHVANSLELLPYLESSPGEERRRLIDLGSGAGFPGLILACALADAGNIDIDLLEANAKKAAFLRDAAMACGVKTRIIHAEISQIGDVYHYVTARAFAPLPRLLDHARHLMSGESVALFLKGREAGKEIDDAATQWRFECKAHDNRFGDGVTLVITGTLSRKPS